MKWFLDLATRTKLFIGFGLMVVFLAAVIISAYNGIRLIGKSQADLFLEDFRPAIELVELKADQNRVRAQLLEMIMIKDRAKQKRLEKDILEQAKDVDTGLKLVSEALKNHPQDLKKYDEMFSSITDYRKTRDEQIALIYEGRTDEAQRMASNVQEDRYNRIRSIAKELGDNVITRANIDRKSVV
jgi:hypothetical protein